MEEYGTAKITVTTKDMSKTATCNITVKGIDVTGVSLNEKNVTIQVNQQKTLIATVTPDNATNKNVSWTSSKPSVATVENGVVRGISVGTTVIIVKTEDGAKTASCTITVEEAADLSAGKTEVIFDAEAADDGTQTAEPVTFTLYNNTDDLVTGVSAVLTSGEAFDVQVPDSIAANGSVEVTITPKADLPVGVYEDTITVTSGENTIVVPIRFEVKAKGSGSNNGSGDNGGNGNDGEESGGQGNGSGGEDAGGQGNGSGGNGSDDNGHGNGSNDKDTGNSGARDTDGNGGKNNSDANTGSSGDNGSTGNTGQNDTSNNGSENDSAQPTVLPVGTVVDNPADKSKYKVLSNTTVAYSTTTNVKAKQIVIPNTVTFNGMKYNVTEIAPNAFKKCKKLTKVTIGSNVKKIGKNAFNGCKNLKTVTIKTTKLNKKSIGKNAFKGIYKKATFKCPKKQLKNYKKWIKKAGAPKKAKYKK